MMPESLDEKKAALRKLMLARRALLRPGEIARMSEAAQRFLLGTPEFRAAGVVCCYLPMRGEPCTELIIGACRESGKRVCAPAFDSRSGRYAPVWFPEGAEIVRGLHGAPQPAVLHGAELGESALVVAPGLAFDRRGRRLGRGGGHYDRMLSAPEAASAARVGLAFEFQVLDEVPSSECDVAMHGLATEKGFFRATENGN